MTLKVNIPENLNGFERKQFDDGPDQAPTLRYSKTINGHKNELIIMCNVNRKDMTTDKINFIHIAWFDSLYPNQLNETVRRDKEVPLNRKHHLSDPKLYKKIEKFIKNYVSDQTFDLVKKRLGADINKIKDDPSDLAEFTDERPALLKSKYEKFKVVQAKEDENANFWLVYKDEYEFPIEFGDKRELISIVDKLKYLHS